MPPAAGGGFRRATASRDFVRLWVAQLVSQSGDFVFQIALIWLVYATTHSPVDVGLLAAASIAPGIVAGPFLGVYVDRWDRRRTLIATNLIEGAAVGALGVGVVLGRADLAVLAAAVVGLATAAQLVRTATVAVVPQAVGADGLGAANSLLTFSGSFNQIAGTAVGGVVVALLGAVPPIEYDALTFFAAAAIVAGVDRSLGHPVDAPPERPGFLPELAAGVRFLRGERALLELVVVGVAVNFFGFGAVALFAPYAGSVLGGGAALYGYLLAAIAAGSVGGAYLIGRTDTRRSAGRLLFAGGVGLGGAMVVLGVVRSAPPALVGAALLGVTLAIVNIPTSTLLQARVPGRLLGRVSAVFGALVTASAPIGAAAAGVIAGRSSVSTFILVAGIAIAAIMAVGAPAFRSLRRVEY